MIFKHIRIGYFVDVAVLALALALLPSFSAYAMGMGNNPPTISSVTANPNPTSPGVPSLLTCIASDSDGTITQYEWTADGGTFPNGTTNQILSAPENTIEWTPPAQTGYFNITIKVSDNGGPFGGTPGTATDYLTIFVDGNNNSPVITSLIPEADSVFVGTSIFVIASASDPDGDPLTYQWTVSGGTISGDDDVDPEAILWAAPQTGGDYTITATVTDGRGGQSSQGVVVNVTVATDAGFIPTPFANPVRIATDSVGQIYITDAHKDRILVYDKVGNPVGEIDGLSDPLGIAVSPDNRLFIGEDGADRIAIYSSSGAQLGTFGGPAVQMPNSIDIDPALGLVFAVDSKGAQVLVYNMSGVFQYAIDGSAAVAGGFLFPVGVGVDTANQAIYVSDGGRFAVYGMDYSGNLLTSFGTMGGGDGKFTRPQGVAVDPFGRIFAVDVYQSYIQVFDSTGQFLARVGSFGNAKGDLSVPLDVHVDQFDRLLVTSNNNSRIEVFGLSDESIPLPNVPPTAPALNLPVGGAEVGTHNPDLVVLPAADEDEDVLTYEFEVYPLGQFDPSASAVGVPESPDQISWTVQPALLENTFYEWRARAFDGVAAGPWTDLRTFYVNAINEPPATPAEILIEPGAELRPDGELSWSASADSDAFDVVSYTLEIDDDADFSSVLIRQENIQATSISLESLTDYALLVDDTLYYFRVQAVDDKGGASAWIEGTFYFNRIEIEVSSTPEGARVYIDGSPAYPGLRVSDATPVTLVNVKETLHIVTVVMEGYDPFTAIADNRLGEDAQIVATLTPAVPVAFDHPVVTPPDQLIPGGTAPRSRPFLVDWNFDGTLDMLLSGNDGLVHLVLQGDVPSYQGVLLDPAIVFGSPVGNASVVAVDWDNDTDFDLLIGNASGTILLGLNAGNQEVPDFVDGGPVQVFGLDLQLTADSAPAVADWNDDGKKDLLVGCSTGIIGLYINTGTDEAPEFAYEEFVELEGVQFVVKTGHAVPFVTDWNDDGLQDLLVGSRGGPMYLYLNIGTPDNPVLQDAGPVHYYFNNKKQVEADPEPYSSPYLADTDKDGFRDLVSGNENGEIVVFPGIQR